MLTKRPSPIVGALSSHRRYVLLAIFSLAVFWVMLYSYGEKLSIGNLHYPSQDKADKPSEELTNTITDVVKPSDSQTPKIDENASEDNATIPNYLHLIYALRDPKSGFGFHFKDYLSLYGAVHHWHPDRIYLHTNAAPEALERGRSGESGKWTKLILTHPKVRINKIELQEKAGNGLTIERMEAQTDFVRALVLKEIGGYYIDFDVHALRDIEPLRRSGFKAVVGLESGGAVNLGVLLTAPNSTMISQWVEGMNIAFDGSYVGHANGVCTKIRDHLEGQGNELLVLGQEGFHPVPWSDGEEGKYGLFKNYDIDDGTYTNNLTNFKDGDKLPSFEEEDHVDHSKWDASDKYKKPEWATWSWTKSFTLHAFRFHGDLTDKWNLDHISPKYVLERRSQYARAVYPMAWDMYNKGIISIHDTYTGK